MAAFFPAAVFLAAGIFALATGVPTLLAGGLLLYGILTALLIRLRPGASLPIHALTLAALGVLPWTTHPTARWLMPVLITTVLGALFLDLGALRRRGAAADLAREQLAQQLDRRINELFSLQELSYVLGESLQLDRIAEQVTRYAQRFLQSDGAVLGLVTEDGQRLVVAAAEGTLRHLQGLSIAEDNQALVMQAIMREKIEVAHGGVDGPVVLIAGETVQSGAAAPLRAHGFTMGVLAVAGRGTGPFTPENLWLLSTLTTHVAVVLANSRLFEMVRQAKDEWETAFNALAEGIAVVDGTGRVRRSNEALARMLKLPAPSLMGRPFWETVIGRPDSAAGLIAAVHRGERHAPVVLRSEPLNRMLRLTGALLSESAEEPAVVILIEDVTEQQALETQLIQNEKLAAVGQLVSGVAHELNNPLTSIAGLSEFLLERADLPPQDREHLRVIHEQAERAGRIVGNLLTFARKGSPETEPLDLNDVVARTTMLITYEFKLRGIELVQRIHPAPVMVLGERTELQQVLLNLLTNAVHAVDSMSEGAPRRIGVETAREGGLALVRVRDSGPGIPAALVPQLFTPFFTTKEPGEGTGLGLSISYGIVESHGGKLSFVPILEGGSEFTVTLPAHHQPAAARPAKVAASTPESTAFRAPRRILLMDDDQGVHRMVSALFARDGHSVDVARSGIQALQMAAERRYDLVIADLRATAAPGQLFTDQLLERQPQMRSRLLLATADASREAVEELRKNGYRVVVKPFKLRDLRDAAGEVWGLRTED